MLPYCLNKVLGLFGGSNLALLRVYIGEGNGSPLQYSYLENPRDRGAWWAAVYGAAQSRTRLKPLSSMCKADSYWEPALSHRELSAGLCDDLEAWDIPEGGDLCTFMVDSRCVVEINTTLKSNFPPIKKQKESRV